MTDESAAHTNWGELWRSGALPRFCFISLGLTFHSGAENMISTIMPAMVREIGGVELNGWVFAIYEIGSIIAGAVTGRLTTYWSVRTNMIVAALIFTLGTLETALSATMYWALIGRLISGFGGGALISLSFVAVQRYFPSSIWPQLMAVFSVVWGVSAFGGPLYGGIMQTLLSWRWAFLIFAAAAVVFAIACVPLLRNEPERTSASLEPRNFPALALTFLALGITAIATAGVESRSYVSLALVIAGLAGIAAFFVLDARNKTSRLFPAAPFNPRTVVGSGMLMVAALSVSTCSFGFYGPLLLASLHDFSPVTTGLIIASESISWSILSILVATAPKQHEVLIVRAGALMIAAGVAGFAWVVPSGSMAGLLFFATLQGGGFGILWPFANRRVVEAALPHERELAASAFSTLQRMGYAVGSATAGIIANANGFSGGFTKAAATTAAPPLFLYFIPIALLGCVAAFRLTKANALPAAASP
jgi:MFS family permease